MKRILNRILNKVEIKNYYATMFDIICCYTIVFVILMLICFNKFWLFNRSLIWKQDSPLNFKTLVWYANYLRECINKVLSGNFNLRLWDSFIGEGTDIFLFCNQYCLGDPLYFLSFLVPDKYLYIFYQIVNVLRIYLSGISFIIMCKKFKINNLIPLVSGALIYNFSFYAMLNLERTPFFLIPLPLMPLVVLGAEKIIDGESPFFYTLIIAISAISNVFFFVHISILTFIYVIIRISFKPKLLIVEKIKLIFWIGIWTIIALLLASVVLIPVLKVILLDGRIGVDYPTLITYPLTYYAEFINNYIAIGTYPWETQLGFPVTILIAIYILFIQKKDNILKVLYIILLVMLLVPIFGKIMNGNQYIINRWNWGFALLNAFIMSFTFNKIIEIDNNSVKFFLPLLITYFILILITGAQQKTILQFSVLLVFLIGSMIKTDREIYKLLFLFSVTCISIIINCNFLFSDKYSNYANACFLQNEVNSELLDSDARVILDLQKRKLSENEYVRYAAPNYSYKYTNGGMLYKQSSVNYFNSYTPNKLRRFKFVNGLFDSRNTINFWGYGLNTVLLQLASVKYVTSTNDKFLPYNYTFLDKINGINYYENSKPLPLIYKYDQYVQEEELITYHPTFIQNTLLSTACIDNYKGKIEHITKIDSNNVKDLQYKIVSVTKDVEINDNYIVVYKPNQKVLLNFNSDDKSELHLFWQNLDFKSFTEYDLFYKESIDIDGKIYKINQNKKYKLSDKSIFYKIKKLYEKILKGIGVTNVKINYEIDKVRSFNQYYVNKNYQFYGGEHNFNTNLGFFEKPISNITITLSDIGVYKFDGLHIYEQLMGEFDNCIDNLRDTSISEIRVDDDMISCNTNFDNDSFICIAMPYYDGWKAYVDEEETELYCTNIYHMGLDVPSGSHSIKLIYSNKYVILGRIISLIGGITFIIMFAAYKHYMKTKNNKSIILRGENYG